MAGPTLMVSFNGWQSGAPRRLAGCSFRIILASFPFNFYSLGLTPSTRLAFSCIYGFIHLLLPSAVPLLHLLPTTLSPVPG